MLAMCVLASLLEFERTTSGSLVCNKVYSGSAKYSYSTFAAVEILGVLNRTCLPLHPHFRTFLGTSVAT